MQTQAGYDWAAYGAVLVPDQDSMLPYLAAAAVELRTAADRKQVHVAASADLDQSTIWRFEQGQKWPRDADAVIAAYADDLGIAAGEIWARALQLWDAAMAPTRPEDALAGGKRTASGTAAPEGELGRRLEDDETSEQSPGQQQTREEHDDRRRTAA